MHPSFPPLNRKCIIIPTFRKERQNRECPQKDPEGGKALTSNPIFQLDRRWTRELASKRSAGASGLTSRYVRTSRPTDACKQWNIPLPLKNVVKLMWFQVP